jgi:Tol biopolymer transport system component/predicted Ser/Thr protein kinase
VDSEGSISGQRVGVYELQALLGAGGMGVVYRALDTRLNRTVAIKFLSDEIADAAARRRFQREAQTASSLNHPHILTVHDAGELDGRQYLVTEFVDGGTLKEWARATPHDWRDIVELLLGVADGLAAAHQAGVLHRDIKPENILIAKNGYAKLADFGLAKLQEDDAAHATRTRTAQATRAGIIVGTAAYMSPEQASGQPLDARSDIFSFGVVLYELLSGRRPFTGTSDLDVLHAIVHAPPAPLPDTLPPALRALVATMLEKDPAKRGAMSDVVAGLRRLVRQSGEGQQAAAAASRSKRWFLWRAIAAVSFGVLSFLAVKYAQPSRSDAGRSVYTQLTNFADSATSPALSPDGRMLAFIRGPSTFAGPGQIYVKLLPDGEPVQLTNDTLDKMGPAFSPDGARIAYTGVDSAAFASMDTFVVPTLGGRPQRLLTNAVGLTWLRDSGATLNRRPAVLFSVMTGRGAQMSLVSATESRSDLHRVYDPRPPDGMAHRSYVSPDGKWVLAVEMDIRSWLPCRLLPFDGSSPGQPVGPTPAQCTDAAWSPDGKWMYFTATTSSGVHTWRQRFPDGTPEQITFGVTSEEGIAFAPDGHSFVTSVGTSQSTVWVHDPRGDRQVTSEGYGFLPSFSPDGRKLYYLVRTFGIRSWYQGRLWVADVQTGQRERLLPDFEIIHYTISSDGQRIVFVAIDDKGQSVWLAPLDGRTPPRQLTTMNASTVFFGAQGEVIFGDVQDGFVYRVKEDGSDLRKVIDVPALLPFAVSPDGRWVSVQDSQAFGAIVLYPLGGGPPLHVCALCARPQGTDWIPPSLTWTLDGKFVYVRFAGSLYAIALGRGQRLPVVPEGGFPSKEAIADLPGARLVTESPDVYPGPDPSIYTFLKVSTQRNLYRVPVP